MKADSLFTISKLAKDAGVGVETIRFYERKGLVRQPTRGGRTRFREYSRTDVMRIQFIRRAQALGFTLSEIQEIFKFEQNARIRCSELKKKVDSKVQEIITKIEDLNKMKKVLTKLAKACDHGVASVKECRISDCFEKEECCQ